MNQAEPEKDAVSERASPEKDLLANQASWKDVLVNLTMPQADASSSRAAWARPWSTRRL
jgi:hypothetical protein